MMDQRRVPAHQCPHCSEVNDAATALQGPAIPGDGDLTVCFYCGEWGVFVLNDGILTVRKPTDSERRELKGTATGAKLEYTTRSIKRLRARQN